MTLLSEVQFSTEARNLSYIEKSADSLGQGLANLGTCAKASPEPAMPIHFCPFAATA